ARRALLRRRLSPAADAGAAQALLRILPLRIQRVQTSTRCTPPPITARTSCRLGFQRRLVLLLAWLTLLPTEGRLPHIEQCLIADTPCCRTRGRPRSESSASELEPGKFGAAEF